MMLKIESLNAYYGRLQALFDINLEMNKGEIIGVLGPNGAGKTTLLKSIINVEVSKTGRILFKDVEITTLPTHKIASLGIYYIPDYGGLFPGLTIIENLQLAANSKYVSIDELKEFYPPIIDLLNRKADSLSGGERKIISIIRSIVVKPELLLLDEPTEGMAPVMVDRTIKLLKKLNEEKNMSILWIEPGAKIRKVLEIADKILILAAGRIVYVGESEKALKEIDEIKKYLFI